MRVNLRHVWINKCNECEEIRKHDLSTDDADYTD